MIEFYPQLGERFETQQKSELHKIGFTEWVHLNKDKRDGKTRLTWTHPVEGHKEWFLVLLVLEEGRLLIDLLRGPLGHTFDRTDVNGLITFINKSIRN